MSANQDARELLAQQDPIFRQMLDEHRAHEHRLHELNEKGWLTAEEEQEEKLLKKEKLKLKDKMAARMRERQSPTS